MVVILRRDSAAGTYRAPEVERLAPDRFHYYGRDSRRAVPPVQVIRNPAFGPDGSAQAVKAIAADGNGAALEEVAGQSVVEDVVRRPPTKKYEYRVSEEQPPATGYFTITNVH